MSSTRRRMKPNPSCPIDKPCKGRRERECRPAKCNRYGDSCWCETRRRTGRQAPDEHVQPRENTEFDFVEGEPDEWEIACAEDDDCPHRWYCFEEVSLSIFPIFFPYKFLSVVPSPDHVPYCCLEKPFCASHKRDGVKTIYIKMQQ